MSSAPLTKGLRGAVAPLIVVALGAAVACSENLPQALEKPTAAEPTAKPVGFDARPISPTCVATAKPTVVTNGTIGFSKTVTNLKMAVEVVPHDGDLYVLQQAGRVNRVEANGIVSLVADLGSRVVSGGEAGLLGIAFHPQFATNGWVFLYYTAPHPTQPPPNGVVFQSILARFESHDGGATLDLASEKRLMTVDQPFTNHDGGTIAFGPDGFLYWGLGDGGSAGDPQGNAQNPMKHLGKMLRIDVDGGDPYAIPSSNPFADGTAGKPEIFALGLRNPYRFRFDPVTGVLWAGDVGQGAREEIDKVVLGGNYGWNVREGKICFAEATCDDPYIDPVVDHPRDQAVTITGGVVYRGTGVPQLTGKYVYGDFGLGAFYAIAIDDPAPTPLRLDDGLPRTNPAAFAIDKDGEIVFLDYYTGDLVKLVDGTTTTAAPEMPAKLSATGCVAADDPKKPATGLFPYDVNVTPWADGATAERYLSVPAGAVLASDAAGRLALPPGSVAMKTLRAEGRNVETQLLLKRPDATWSAYAYVWSDDQRDATLVSSGTTAALPSGQRHVVVSTAQCMTCHADTANATIGLEASQLDRDDVDYGGRQGNPLATLEKLGMLAAPVAQGSYAPLPRPHGFDTADLRARGYLHANCAFCHHGGGDAFDLRYGINLHDMRVCNVAGAPQAGGKARLVPGAPQESELVKAMQSTGVGRMPPLGSLVPDDDGIQSVSSWIASLATCP